MAYNNVYGLDSYGGNQRSVRDAVNVIAAAAVEQGRDLTDEQLKKMTNACLWATYQVDKEVGRLLELQIITDKTTIDVAEGGSNTLSVRLKDKPESNVSVEAVKSGGTKNSSVTFAPSTLTFTPENWSVNQSFTINAPEDTNNVNEGYGYHIKSSGGGYDNIFEYVNVNVTDNDPV